ncbi:MAG: cytochrome C [Sphingobium sp.]
MLSAMPRLLLFFTVLILLTAGQMASGEPDGSVSGFGMTDAALARSDYIENCGGCHGVRGSTAPAQVPELRGRVGYFLCTPETRAYLLRLPNVAHSKVTDDQQLSDLMNYVVYVLGEGSVPPGRRPFTAEEVRYERTRALTSANLTQERARNVAIAMQQCHAPASLREMYDRPFLSR